MHLYHVDDITPFTSPHGERVQELMGTSAGGATQHSLAQITLPPGAASRKHYHPQAEESYFILCGRARVEIEGETETFGVGVAVAIPAQQVHQIWNASLDEDLVFLAVCAPPWTPDCSVFLDEG